MVEALTMRKQRNSLGFFSIRSDTQGQWRLLLKDKLDMGVTEYTLCPRGGVTSGPAKCSLASLQPLMKVVYILQDCYKAKYLLEVVPLCSRVSQEQSLLKLDPTSAFQQPHLHRQPLRKILSCLGRMQLMPLILGHIILDRINHITGIHAYYNSVLKAETPGSCLKVPCHDPSTKKDEHRCGVSSTNDRAKSDDDAAAPPSFAAIKKPQDVQ
ncbi:hypothetical protein VNO77_34283 [Canavalia gladiata]|uniref:Uncharacterized protein n=1 Tax=Canavalia gladiata TaxID=3824 RepID=A0AAN9KDC3_CANGL